MVTFWVKKRVEKQLQIEGRFSAITGGIDEKKRFSGMHHDL